jgi:hypothetical protein
MGAEQRFLELYQRAHNAAAAIDEGSMPDLQTINDMKDVITPDLQVKLETLDKGLDGTP